MRTASCCLLLALVVHAEGPLEGFPAEVEALMKEYSVPGVAVAVVREGKVALARGFDPRRTT